MEIIAIIGWVAVFVITMINPSKDIVHYKTMYALLFLCYMLEVIWG